MDHHPRLVAFDLDGTLAESKQRMSSDMGEMLSRLLKKMPIAVMSGAGWPQFEKQFFPGLPMETNLHNLYIFPDNAAQCFVYRGGGWKPQYDNAFTPAEREHVLKALDEALFETGMHDVPIRVWGQRIEDRGAEIVFSGLGQEAPTEEKRKWDPTREKRKPLYDALIKKLPEFAIGLNAMTSIDITRKGITKAYGIKRLSELAGIAIAQMLYVGDALEEGGNDAVVKETGVQTHQVFGPEETAGLITSLLK